MQQIQIEYQNLYEKWKKIKTFDELISPEFYSMLIEYRNIFLEVI